MTRVVSLNIALQGTLLHQDTRWMVEQWKVGIARLAVDGAPVLECEDMLTGKSSNLSGYQCLCLGRGEIPKVRRLPNVRVPQIYSIGGLEGECVIWTGGPSIGLLQTSTSSHAVIQQTSSHVDWPPRRVGNRNSPNNDDDADVVDSRTEGISVNDLEAAGSRVCLELTVVLMHILAIAEGAALQSESNCFCSHKARSRVDNEFHLSQVLVLARTFLLRTSANSPRSSSIKRTLDLSSEYIMPCVNSCCTGSICSELWVERTTGRSRHVPGEELQVVCVCGAPAIDLDPGMSL